MSNSTQRFINLILSKSICCICSLKITAKWHTQHIRVPTMYRICKRVKHNSYNKHTNMDCVVSLRFKMCFFIIWSFFVCLTTTSQIQQACPNEFIWTFSCMELLFNRLMVSWWCCYYNRGCYFFFSLSIGPFDFDPNELFEILPIKGQIFPHLI